MKNFNNIHEVVKITTQEKTDNLVIKKKRGRPKSDNMKTIAIRLDKSLNAELNKQSKILGAGKSVLVSMALKSFFDKREKKYKMVEID